MSHATILKPYSYSHVQNIPADVYCTLVEYKSLKPGVVLQHLTKKRRKRMECVVDNNVMQ